MTAEKPHIPRRKQDRIEFSVNVATLVSMLSGGALYYRDQAEERAADKARLVVLEERLIQLQSQLGEANARLAHAAP